MNKSYKMEVCTKGEWSTNSCVYATEKEAVEAGKELLSRWMVPTDSRAVESDKPVNYRFNFETYKSESIN